MGKKSSSTHQKPSLRAKKKDLTRKAILKEAEKILSEKMLSEINTGDIADAAVVSRTTIYNYFKNKEEIFFGIGTQLLLEINESFKTLPMGLSGLELVIGVCKAIITGSIEKPILFTILRDFYNRINYHDIPIEAMHEEIINNLNTLKYKELLLDFNEPYLIEFYVQHRDNQGLASAWSTTDTEVTFNLLGPMWLGIIGGGLVALIVIIVIIATVVRRKKKMPTR